MSTAGSDDDTDSDRLSECPTVYPDDVVDRWVLTPSATGNGALPQSPLQPIALRYSRRSVTVGRGSACDVVVASKKVSARHAALELVPNAATGTTTNLFLMDVGSCNGTYLARPSSALGSSSSASPSATFSALMPFRWYGVAAGDRIRIGAHEFVVHWEASAPASQPAGAQSLSTPVKELIFDDVTATSVRQPSRAAAKENSSPKQADNTIAGTPPPQQSTSVAPVSAGANSVFLHQSCEIFADTPPCFAIEDDTQAPPQSAGHSPLPPPPPPKSIFDTPPPPSLVSESAADDTPSTGARVPPAQPPSLRSSDGPAPVLPSTVELFDSQTLPPTDENTPAKPTLAPTLILTDDLSPVEGTPQRVLVVPSVPVAVPDQNHNNNTLAPTISIENNTMSDSNSVTPHRKPAAPSLHNSATTSSNKNNNEESRQRDRHESDTTQDEDGDGEGPCFDRTNNSSDVMDTKETPPAVLLSRKHHREATASLTDNRKAASRILLDEDTQDDHEQDKDSPAPRLLRTMHVGDDETTEEEDVAALRPQPKRKVSKKAPAKRQTSKTVVSAASTPTASGVMKRERDDMSPSSETRKRRKSSPPPVKTPNVCVTRFVLDSRVKAGLERTTGMVFVPINLCSHLVVAEPVKRTIKFLCALNTAEYIVTKKWLDACRKARGLVEPDDYAVRDTEMERSHNFSVPTSLLRAHAHRVAGTTIFEGRSIFITKSVQPREDGNDIRDIVTSGGGVVGRAPNAKTLFAIVAVPADVGEAKRRRSSPDIPIVPPEYLFECTMHQTLKDPTEYDLTRP